MLAKSGIEVEVSLPSEREIMFTCRFRRPRRLLFSAWTQPEHVREWWGCEGARITGCEIDLRVGGAWKVVMQMADGSEHPFRGVYQEITNEERLEYTECYDMPSLGRPEWVTTVTFEETEGGTTLTHKIRHRSRDARDGHLKAGMEAGSIQALQQLDRVVSEVIASSR